MIKLEIEKLLVLQDKDISYQKLVKEIERIPVECSSTKNLIVKEENEIDLARKDLNQKEVDRVDLDNEIKTKESNIQKFKNQQLEVKKNDEYKALSNQINQTESEISELEEKEIAIMYEIDSEKESFDKAKSVIEHRIKIQEKKIDDLNLNLVKLKEDLKVADQEYKSSREGIAEEFLKLYDQTKKQIKRAPYIVPLEEQICGGCHLRVSNDVYATAMSGTKIVCCDLCSRILYKL